MKPYVLRYWEQEFTQLKPMKRRGNRRYYQHHEVLLIRRIRELLYEQGFTISGARNRLVDTHQHARAAAAVRDANAELEIAVGEEPPEDGCDEARSAEPPAAVEVSVDTLSPTQMRQELMSIRGLLAV